MVENDITIKMNNITIKINEIIMNETNYARMRPIKKCMNITHE